MRPSNAELVALRKAIGDVLLTFEDWPQHQSQIANAEREMALDRLRTAALRGGAR